MNCKQGDLAIIVRARHPENLGKIVEVVRHARNGEETKSLCGRTVFFGWDTLDVVWWIRSHGSPLVCGVDETVLAEERAFSDLYLRPIPRLDEPEETTTDEELTV